MLGEHAHTMPLLRPGGGCYTGAMIFSFWRPMQLGQPAHTIALSSDLIMMYMTHVSGFGFAASVLWAGALVSEDGPMGRVWGFTAGLAAGGKSSSQHGIGLFNSCDTTVSAFALP
jgi:hypothetical protein